MATPPPISAIDVNRVMHTTAANMFASLASESVDLIFTSPPYPGVKFWHDRDITDDDIFKMVYIMILESARVLRPGGYLTINHAEVPRGNLGLASIASTIKFACSQGAFTHRGRIIWTKGVVGPLPPPCFMRRPCVPHLTHEYVDIYVKGNWQAREKPITISPEEKKWLTQSVWQICPDHDRERRQSSLPFPLELADRIVRLFSLEGEVVCDPFAGVGTTAIAAITNGRRFVGCDNYAPAVTLANARIEKILGVTL